MTRPSTRMQNANRFKLGLFATNCSGGLAMTKVPECWIASWDNALAANQLAEAAGLEFTLPIARWHGYRGETDAEGSTYETLTWAAGTVAATDEIVVFGTVHVPFLNPVFAAKMMVTADHIGRGRFGLNIVSGWNEGEFNMFGTRLLEHDERYAYSEEWIEISEEWIEIVNRIWAEGAPFDFKGKYFDMTGVQSRPKPHGGGRPLVLSAGSSPAGRAFAMRHADCLFMIIVDIESLAKETASIRAIRDTGEENDAGIYCISHVVCRPTQKEAEEYYHYYVHDMGDWEAAEHLLQIRQGQQQSIPPERFAQIKERFVSGLATYPVVGSPDRVAEAFHDLNNAGIDGMAFGLVNYIDELPYFRDEVLPRMVRLGLREAA